MGSDFDRECGESNGIINSTDSSRARSSPTRKSSRIKSTRYNKSKIFVYSLDAEERGMISVKVTIKYKYIIS